MKTLTKMHTFAALILTGAMLGLPADAADDFKWTYELIATPATDPVSGTDLINAGQPSFLSASSTSNVTYHSGSSLSAVNDGVFGNGALVAGSLNPVEGATVTFTLNTATRPEGYRLGKICSYASYTDGRRSYQKYDVDVHTVGTAPETFSRLVSAGPIGYFTGGAEWTKMTVSAGASDYTTMTSGVDQIRLTFHIGYFGTGGEQPGLGWSSYYREIDVFEGTAPYVPLSGTRDPPPATNVAATVTYSLTDPPAADAVSTNDLLNVGQTAFYPHILFDGDTEWVTRLDALNDGSFGNLAWNSAGTTEFAPVDGSVVTYSFNTADHAYRFGVDVKQIVSFAAYGDGRHAVQRYDVAVHYVGTAAGTFVALSQVNNLGLNTGAAEWTQVSIGDGNSVIARGVDQIRFTFHSNGIPSGGTVVYREIDVFGSAVLPPAGTLLSIR